MGRASKDKRDMYYRKAKEEGYRARSAYKLLQLHEEFDILRMENISTGVVDLCAAPGSWSQVLAAHIREANAKTAGETNTERPTARIVAVDLQEMMPIEGVQLLQGDITSEATAREIIRLLNCDVKDTKDDGKRTTEKGMLSTNNQCCDSDGNNNDDISECSKKADLVVCDGAPDVTGMHELDEYLQHHLLLAALNITTFVLRRGGTFVTKMFRGPNTPFLVAKSEVFFQHVFIAKPKSSRNASMEAFLICQNYQPPVGYRPSFDCPLTTTTRCFTPAAPLPPSLASNRHCEENSANSNDYSVKKMGNDFETEWRCQGSVITITESVVVPFLACGDLSGYDADMCYDRDNSAPVLPPVHPPLQAPYITPSDVSSEEAVVGGHIDEGKRRRVENAYGR